MKIYLDKKRNDLKKDVPDNLITSIYNSEGIINEIMNICKTYTDHWDDIEYGNSFTPWDKECKRNNNNKWELDCSSFMGLLITGTTFENSRFNSKSNNISHPLFFQHIDFMDIRYANEIGKWCFENGYTFEPNEDLSNIRAGDICFFSWNNFEENPQDYDQPSLDFHNNAWRKIDHIAMYFERKNESIHQTIQYEQYTPAFLYETNNEYMSQCILVARLPFANIQNNNTKNLIVDGNRHHVQTAGMEVGQYHLNQSLEKGKMYTLSLHGKVNTENCYWLLQANDKTIYSCHGSKDDVAANTKAMYFIYDQDEPADMVKLLIGCSDNNVTDRSGYVDWIALNEGYRIVANKEQKSDLCNCREIPLSEWIQEQLIGDFAFTNNLIEYDTHILINLNISVKEEFITNEIQITNDIGIRLGETQRIPCTLIAEDGTVTGGALQLRYDGTINIVKYNSTGTWKHAIASGIIIKK